MPTALYVWDNPIDRFAKVLNKKIDQWKSSLETCTIKGLMETISCRIHELTDNTLQVIPNLNETETLRWKWEYNTRELLKDTHNTFWLLMHWLSIASDYLKQGKKVSVGLYKEDIRHKNFIEWVKNATENWVHSKSLTLDIHWDNYGFLGEKSIKKLYELSELWVWIGIEAFDEKQDWEIDIDSITRIIRWRIKPKFIKISSSVMQRLKNNSVTTRVANLYTWLIKMWVRVIEYISWITKKEDIAITNKQREIADTLIDSANIEYEPMLTLQWEVWVEELLVRFDNWLRTDIWLTQLKELWYTEGLVIKMLWAAINRAREGNRVSINLYIKDMWSSTIIEIISTLTQNLPIQYRKNIIFELLEERYWSIDEKFIKHVHSLQNSGFSIAIDDLYVSEENEWMSIEILNELLDMGIYPDYIKLDGKHSLAIRDNSISKTDLGKIKTLIWQFALQKKITVVAEWIQDMEHATKIREIFQDITWINLIFQWREINIWNFGEK